MNRAATVPVPSTAVYVTERRARAALCSQVLHLAVAEQHSVSAPALRTFVQCVYKTVRIDSHR